MTFVLAADPAVERLRGLERPSADDGSPNPRGPPLYPGLGLSTPRNGERSAGSLGVGDADVYMPGDIGDAAVGVGWRDTAFMTVDWGMPAC